MSITFYGAVDRKRDKETGENKISSEYPAWTFPQQIENAKEDLAQKERALQTGSVDRGSEGEYRLLIEREKKQLEAIEASRPKLNDVEMDTCDKAYKDISKGVGESMPTLKDMHRNFIDAHEENRRNQNPCIKVSGKTAEIAEQNGIRVTKDCEMSRKDAWKLGKILGHILGKPTNMERLRKEGYSGVGRPRG